jgi:tetratricopeptide (TPR) repeat protein
MSVYRPDVITLELRLHERQASGYPVELALVETKQTFNGLLPVDVLPWNTSGDSKLDGQRLFKALFSSAEMLKGWGEASGRSKRRRLQIRLDAPELHALPWELLRDGTDLLAADADTPFSRYLAVSREWGRPITARPLRVLAVISTPIDLTAKYNLPAADVDLETQVLTEVFAPFSQGGKSAGDVSASLTFLSAPITLERLEVELRQGYHILHFVGHGVFNEKKQQAVLYFQDANGNAQRIVDEDLAGMLNRLAAPPHMVVLAACQSAKQSLGEVFTGLGPQLVQIGVPAVIAMQENVTVLTARQFATTFYQRLLEHGVVDLAMNEARSALITQGRFDAAVPVLFMRVPDGRIFDKARVKDATAGKKRVHWRVALLMTITLLVIIGLGALLLRPASSDLVRVGIASFVNCPDVANRLRNAIAVDNGEATFTPLVEIRDETAARASKELDLVIWGECATASEATLRLEILLARGPDEAIELERLTTRTSTLDLDRSARLSRAMIRYLHGDYNEAASRLAVLQQEASTPLERAELAFLRANSLLFLERYEEAIEVYETALEDSAIQAQVHHNRGVAALNWALQLGRAGPAPEYDEVLQAAMDDLTAAIATTDTRVQVFAYLNRAAARYFATASYDSTVADEAVADCEHAITLASDEPRGYVCRAAARYRVMEEDPRCPLRDTTSVRNDLAAAQQLNSKLADIFFWRGSLASLQEGCDEAERDRLQRDGLADFKMFLDLASRQSVKLATNRLMCELSPALLTEKGCP